MTESNGREALKTAFRSLYARARVVESMESVAQCANERMARCLGVVGAANQGAITHQQIAGWKAEGKPAKKFQRLWWVVVELTMRAHVAENQKYLDPPDGQDHRRWRPAWRVLYGEWEAIHRAAGGTPATSEGGAGTTAPTSDALLSKSGAFTTAIGRPLEFHGVNVGLQVLVGSFISSYSPADVEATLTSERWTAPSELKAYAPAYADRKGFYKGEVVRLNELGIEPYSADGGISEHHRLLLNMAPIDYFDMVATNIALGPFTVDEAPLLDGYNGIKKTRMSNMMQVELALITSDGYVPVFRRATKMAALEECWQITSGESVQRPQDLDTDGRPDLFKTAVRGLSEEVGLKHEPISDLAIMALVATPEFATIGVLMCGNLHRTSGELNDRLSANVLAARDNWEHTAQDLVPIDDARSLAVALTDRKWSKQSAATMIFAHAKRAGGKVERLAAAIKAGGGLKLEAGSPVREVVPANERDELARKYLVD